MQLFYDQHDYIITRLIKILTILFRKIDINHAKAQPK